jgi:hypothetical protein
MHPLAAMAVGLAVGIWAGLQAYRKQSMRRTTAGRTTTAPTQESRWVAPDMECTTPTETTSWPLGLADMPNGRAEPFCACAFPRPAFGETRLLTGSARHRLRLWTTCERCGAWMAFDRTPAQVAAPASSISPKQPLSASAAHWPEGSVTLRSSDGMSEVEW